MISKGTCKVELSCPDMLLSWLISFWSDNLLSSSLFLNLPINILSEQACSGFGMLLSFLIFLLIFSLKIPTICFRSVTSQEQVPLPIWNLINYSINFQLFQLFLTVNLQWVNFWRKLAWAILHHSLCNIHLFSLNTCLTQVPTRNPPTCHPNSRLRFLLFCIIPVLYRHFEGRLILCVRIKSDVFKCWVIG